MMPQGNPLCITPGAVPLPRIGHDREGPAASLEVRYKGSLYSRGSGPLQKKGGCRVYKQEEVEARVGQMSPILRGLVEEMLRRGEQFDHRIPLDEALDSDLVAQLRLVFSEPALKQEWVEFWTDLRDACREDAAAIERGEHDHEL